MKKIIAILLLVAMTIPTLTSCTKGTEKRTLNVYNWGENISDGTDDSLDVIAEFEAKNPDIKVNYTNYATNEEMYAKIKSSGASYDVIIPSDYMIGKMISEDMLEELDFNNIPNYKDSMPEVESQMQSFDPDKKYAVPYTWGTVGIIYNKTMVSDPVDSWDILWNEKYKGKILMFDNSRDAFGIAQKKLGFSQNTENSDEINLCGEELKKQRPLVQAYVMDQIFDKMGAGEAALAPYYAGDAVMMMDENPDLDFVIPKEGSNKFVDAMVIPKGAKNKTDAEKFINFMCDTEIAKANIEYINYSTPLKAVFDTLPDEVKNNVIIYPNKKDVDRCENFLNLDKAIAKIMEDLWIKVKSN